MIEYHYKWLLALALVFCFPYTKGFGTEGRTKVSAAACPLQAPGSVLKIRNGLGGRTCSSLHMAENLDLHFIFGLGLSAFFFSQKRKDDTLPSSLQSYSHYAFHEGPNLNMTVATIPKTNEVEIVMPRESQAISLPITVQEDLRQPTLNSLQLPTFRFSTESPVKDGSLFGNQHVFLPSYSMRRKLTVLMHSSIPSSGDLTRSRDVLPAESFSDVPIVASDDDTRRVLQENSMENFVSNIGELPGALFLEQLEQDPSATVSDPSVKTSYAWIPVATDESQPTPKLVETQSTHGRSSDIIDDATSPETHTAPGLVAEATPYELGILSVMKDKEIDTISSFVTADNFRPTEAFASSVLQTSDVEATSLSSGPYSSTVLPRFSIILAQKKRVSFAPWRPAIIKANVKTRRNFARPRQESLSIFRPSQRKRGSFAPWRRIVIKANVKTRRNFARPRQDSLSVFQRGESLSTSIRDESDLRENLGESSLCMAGSLGASLLPDVVSNSRQNRKEGDLAEAVGAITSDTDMGNFDHDVIFTDFAVINTGDKRSPSYVDESSVVGATTLSVEAPNPTWHDGTYEANSTLQLGETMDRITKLWWQGTRYRPELDVSAMRPPRSTGYQGHKSLPTDAKEDIGICAGYPNPSPSMPSDVDSSHRAGGEADSEVTSSMESASSTSPSSTEPTPQEVPLNSPFSVGSLLKSNNSNGEERSEIMDSPVASDSDMAIEKVRFQKYLARPSSLPQRESSESDKSSVNFEISNSKSRPARDAIVFRCNPTDVVPSPNQSSPWWESSASSYKVYPTAHRASNRHALPATRSVSALTCNPSDVVSPSAQLSTAKNSQERAKVEYNRETPESLSTVVLRGPANDLALNNNDLTVISNVPNPLLIKSSFSNTRGSFEILEDRTAKRIPDRTAKRLPVDELL